MPGETAFSPPGREELQFGERVRGVAALANRQHGIVTRRQLLDLGLSSSTVGRQVELGRLHPIHGGVYAVGHRNVTREARWLAAVLAGGPGAVLSHRSAAQLWGLQQPVPGPIAITVPRAAALEVDCNGIAAN